MKRLVFAVSAVLLISFSAGCSPSTPKTEVIQPAGIGLYQQFGSATVSPDTTVSTPTGKGAFASAAWETAQGPARAVVIVTGFSAAFPAVLVESGAKLKFTAGMPYKSLYPAHFWVGTQGADGAVTRIWEEDFQPPTGDLLEPRPIEIALDTLAGTSPQFVIGVETINGDPTGHWGVFIEPTIE